MENFLFCVLVSASGATNVWKVYVKFLTIYSWKKLDYIGWKYLFSKAKKE